MVANFKGFFRCIRSLRARRRRRTAHSCGPSSLSPPDSRTALLPSARHSRVPSLYSSPPLRSTPCATRFLRDAAPAPDSRAPCAALTRTAVPSPRSLEAPFFPPLECFGYPTFVDKLTLLYQMPLLLMFLLLVGSLATGLLGPLLASRLASHGALRKASSTVSQPPLAGSKAPAETSRQQQQQARLQRAWRFVRGRLLHVTPTCLMLFYFFYPLVVATAFRAFSLDCFKGPEEQEASTVTAASSIRSTAEPTVCYVSADYSTVACNRAPGGTECVYTTEYESVRSTAQLVLLLYALLLPSLLLYLLLRARHAIEHDMKTPLATALLFLHKPYRPTFYYFELVEMLRKQILIGFAVFVSPGSLLQLIFGLGVALVAHALFTSAAPFEEKSDSAFASVTNLATVLLMLACVMVRCSLIIGTLETSAVQYGP